LTAEGDARRELLAAVTAAKMAGGSVRAIAAFTKKSPTTIQKWLRGESC
jgi:transposase